MTTVWFTSTPLVTVTGCVTEDDKRRARDAGFDYHLTKPAGADSLAHVLTQIFGIPTQARAPCARITDWACRA